MVPSWAPVIFYKRVKGSITDHLLTQGVFFNKIWKIFMKYSGEMPASGGSLPWQIPVAGRRRGAPQRAVKAVYPYILPVLAHLRNRIRVICVLEQIGAFQQSWNDSSNVVQFALDLLIQPRRTQAFLLKIINSPHKSPQCTPGVEHQECLIKNNIKTKLSTVWGEIYHLLTSISKHTKNHLLINLPSSRRIICERLSQSLIFLH